MNELFIANIIGYINLCFIVLAGLFIVSKQKKYKIIGVLFYFSSNLCFLTIGLLTGLHAFSFSFFIFVGLNTINLIRITKQ